MLKKASVVLMIWFCWLFFGVLSTPLPKGGSAPVCLADSHTLSSTPVITTVAAPPVEEEKRVVLLNGTWEGQAGIVVDLDGEQPTGLKINWSLTFDPDEGAIKITQFGIVADSVPMERGDSGVISLFANPTRLEEADVAFDADEGWIEVSFPAFYHFGLIDQLAGYRPFDDTGEMDDLRPYLFDGIVRLAGRFEGISDFSDGGQIPFKGDLNFVLKDDGEDNDWRPPPEIWPKPYRAGFNAQSFGGPLVVKGPYDIYKMGRSDGPWVHENYCAYPWQRRRITLQPVFVDPTPLEVDRRAGTGGSVATRVPSTPSSATMAPVPNQPWTLRTNASGKSFLPMIKRAMEIWEKCCVYFDVMPPVYVQNAHFMALNSGLEASDFINSYPPNGRVINVYIAEKWDVANQKTNPKYPNRPDNVFQGGGWCGSGGTALAYIITVDHQIDIPASGPGACKNGASGAVNMNHLAHELGHVLGLHHPLYTSHPLGPSSKGTVMETSGYCADNPSKQSVNNSHMVYNPLLRTGGKCCSNPEIKDKPFSWWSRDKQP